MRSNARAARNDSWAIMPAPIRRIMMPGPGAKRKKIPAAATKVPPMMINAFRTGPLLNCCRYLNSCWNRRPGGPALKRCQSCLRPFSMYDPRFTSDCILSHLMNRPPRTSRNQGLVGGADRSTQSSSLSIFTIALHAITMSVDPAPSVVD
jgi:hypothetical protein